jgi:hypothetical protein
MLDPQAELVSNGFLHITTLEHDSQETQPRFKYFAVNLTLLQENEETLHPSPAHIPNTAMQVLKEDVDVAQSTRESYVAGRARQQHRISQVKRQV